MRGLYKTLWTIYDRLNRTFRTFRSKLPQSATTCPKKNFLIFCIAYSYISTTAIYTTSFYPPLKKYYFALAHELAKSPPTIYSNCSKRICLHATVVALKNRLS